MLRSPAFMLLFVVCSGTAGQRSQCLVFVYRRVFRVVSDRKLWVFRIDDDPIDILDVPSVGRQ